MIGMINKEKYMNSFSGVEPSDEIKERILKMTQPKRKIPLKTAAIAVAVLAAFTLAMITANAATDGDLGEKITEAAKSFVVLLNGERVEADIEKSVVENENGDDIAFVRIELPTQVDSETADEILISYFEDELENSDTNTVIGEVKVVRQSAEEEALN